MCWEWRGSTANADTGEVDFSVGREARSALLLLHLDRAVFQSDLSALEV